MPEFAQPAWLALLAVPALLAVLAARQRRGLRSRYGIAAILRALTLAVLVVALAGPLAVSYPRHTDIVYALDLSRSLDRETTAAALAYINQSFAEAPAHARAGLVVFGADAAVEAPVRGAAEPVAEITSRVDRAGTDIGRAIEVAVGAFPADAGTRRIVLLSDGRETLGDARAAAALARSLGVRVDAVALGRAAAGREVRVQSMTAPSRVRMHEPFRVQTIVHSSGNARAHLVIMRNGTLLQESVIDLAPGASVHSFTAQADAPGLLEYEAIVNSDADTEQENNRYQAFVRVQGTPRVLHAAGDPQGARYVSAALRAQGFAVDEIAAAAMPATLHGLLDYELVILDNVSALDLSLPKMELLESYVRDSGGGVIKIGGDRSFGAGGYQGTPIERLLPVAMQVPAEHRTPSLAVVFVLDRSGSMGSRAHGEEKLTIAKKAALASIDLLDRRDRVGVLAFDSEQNWVVPLTDAGMRREIAGRLRELGTGGGTDLYGALEEAHRVMRAERAKVKHLIVLSDGLADGERDFGSIGRRIAADGITVSTVTMGGDADRELMAQLARAGKGRFRHAADPRNVPRIFTSETLAVARHLVVEGSIRPRLAHAGGPVEGFDAAAFPPLGGYLRTYPKPAAQVVLLGREEDPLLVSWRYGLGKTVAFTSDLSGRWGRQWVQWPQFGRFAAQTARWAMRRTGQESFAPSFRWHGRRGEMSVDVLDRDERFVNGLSLEAIVVAPDRAGTRVPLEQTAPGRYAGTFEVPGPGRYYVTLAGRRDGVEVGPSTFGLAVPYSAEFLEPGVDRRLLRDMVGAAQGALLEFTATGLETAAAAAPPAPGPRWRIWQPFLLAALVLLILEVAVRRVPLPQRPGDA